MKVSDIYQPVPVKTHLGVGDVVRRGSVGDHYLIALVGPYSVAAITVRYGTHWREPVRVTNFVGALGLLQEDARAVLGDLAGWEYVGRAADLYK